MSFVTALTYHYRATVTEINRNIAVTIKQCGPAILAKLSASESTPVEQIVKTLVSILQKQHPCQKDDDFGDDTESPETENSEYDWLTIETALEIIASLAMALGPQFAELWKIFESSILKFASSSERFERSAAVGTIADCIEGMGEACTPYTQKLMRVFVKRLGDEDLDVKSNSAFGAGMLCANSTDAKEVLGNYNTILQALEPVLSVQNQESDDDSRLRLLDNAAGCVARMIKKAPNNVPLESVLPRLVELLPLKEDYRENEPVFDMIVSLYQSQNSVIQSQTDKMMPVFQKVLGPPEEQISDETRTKVQQLVAYLTT